MDCSEPASELHEVKACFTAYDSLIPVKLLISSIKRYNIKGINYRNGVTTGQEINKLNLMWIGTKRFTALTVGILKLYFHKYVRQKQSFKSPTSLTVL